MEQKKPMSLKITSIEKIVESKKTDELAKCLKRHELDAVSIGEGGNAEIFAPTAKRFKNICAKKIKSQPQILDHNIVAEHDYQARAHKAGVRTPMPILAIVTNEGKHILMERIYGYTVDEVLKRPSLLPKKFDFDTFCNTLEDSIEKLHSIGIYHRDLHAKNVMIDSKTGLPYIIDYGTATDIGSGSDLTYQESIMVLDEKTGKYQLQSGFFKDDNIMFKNLKAGLRQFRKNTKALTS